MHQCQQKGEGRILQSVGLNRVGVRVRVNFQVSLQYQSNAALLVQSHSLLLLAMGERSQSFFVYKLWFPPGARRPPWSELLQVSLHLSTNEGSWRIIVSSQLVLLPRFFIFIFQISPLRPKVCSFAKYN